MVKTHGAFIVAWDFTHGEDKGVLIVGKQIKGNVEVVNAFQGEEALELFKKLSTVKKEE